MRNMTMKLMRNLPLVAAIATFTLVHCAAFAADTWLPDSAGVSTGASSADPAAQLYDASVSIFAESATQARKPLGWGAYDKWPKTPVKAGETTTVVVAPDGTLR